MDSGTDNGSPTLFCQGTESLGPQVSTFLDLALGYNKAPQQATSNTIENHLQWLLQRRPKADSDMCMYKVMWASPPGHKGPFIHEQLKLKKPPTSCFRDIFQQFASHFPTLSKITRGGFISLLVSIKLINNENQISLQLKHSEDSSRFGCFKHATFSNITVNAGLEAAWLDQSLNILRRPLIQTLGHNLYLQ